MKHFRIAGAAIGVAALALPAAASGHGSVFEITAKVAVPNTTPVQRQDQTQYVVSNHGYTFVLRESNGETDHGMVNYKVLPSAYRNQPGFTKTDLLAEGDTGAQPHATCRDVPELDAESAILAWQGPDPFYNYVPFQTTPAGLEDDPADWLAVIKDETGVDLTTVPSAADACTGLGGRYEEADATVTAATSLASGTIADERAPLEAQVGQLTAAKAAAERARATAVAQAAAANAAAASARSDAQRYLLAAAPVAVRLAGSAKARTVASRGASVNVTGPALKPVTVQLQISSKRAKAMGLRSRVIARKVATIGADGTRTVTVKPGRAAAEALRKLKRSLRVSVSAAASSRDSATTTLSR